MKNEKTLRDTAAVARLMRRHHGANAENFVRKQIVMFSNDPGRVKAAAAWQRVLEALQASERRRAEAGCDSAI